MPRHRARDGLGLPQSSSEGGAGKPGSFLGSPFSMFLCKKHNKAPFGDVNARKLAGFASWTAPAFFMRPSPRGPGQRGWGRLSPAGEACGPGGNPSWERALVARPAQKGPLCGFPPGEPHICSRLGDSDGLGARTEQLFSVGTFSCRAGKPPRGSTGARAVLGEPAPFSLQRGQSASRRPCL